MKTLGASMFVHNGEEFDYSYREVIECMKAFADEVVVLDAGSTDGTADVCRSFADAKTKIICVSTEEWNQHSGREKISVFQNKAKNHLGTEYNFQMQADEILHENSFNSVRDAISEGLEAYAVTRFNLWFDPWHQLNVEQERKPCSTSVIRLTKTKYDSVDDGESILAPNPSVKWLNDIRLYHMGFVRDTTKMKAKVIHIQEQVFLIPHDLRLDHAEQFDPFRFFKPTDAIRIAEELPVFIRKWAQHRYPNGPII